MKFINAFQKIGLTLAAIIFSCATLLYSLSPAKADNPNTISSTGKIMMHQNSFVYNGSYYFHVLVWDSETGKSKLYAFDKGSFVRANNQLPTSPLY